MTLKIYATFIIGLSISLAFDNPKSKFEGTWTRNHIDLNSSASTTDSLLLNNRKFIWKKYSHWQKPLVETGRYTIKSDSIHLIIFKESLGYDHNTGRLIFRKVKPAEKLSFAFDTNSDPGPILVSIRHGVFLKSK